MSKATAYIDRDNTITLVLTQDGATPTQDVITKAALWISGSAFSDDSPVVIDTDGANMTLTENATQVELSLGDLNILPGSHTCFLTIYDSANTNGIAWDSFTLRGLNWPA